MCGLALSTMAAGDIQIHLRARLSGMSRRNLLLAALLFAAPAALPLLAAPPSGAPVVLSADSYLPVSDEELAAALAEPAVRCVAAPTPSGCAPDPEPRDPVHPDAPSPASAVPGA